MTATEGIFTGVAAHIVGGLALIVLLYFLRRFVFRFVEWIPGMGARRIEGLWSTTYWKGKQPFQEEATVHQCGRWIWGKICYPEGRTYTFRGKLLQNILVAVYAIKGQPRAIDFGAFTLALDATGDQMTGKYCWTDTQTGEVQADYYEWHRKKTKKGSSKDRDDESETSSLLPH